MKTDLANGQTLRQMALAPRDAAYIGSSRSWVRVEGQRLADSVARPDLVLVGADELLGGLERFAGLQFGGIEIDPAARISRAHQRGLEYLRLFVRRRPVSDMNDHGTATSL